MKLSIRSRDLANALRPLGPRLPKKPPNPNMAGIRLHAAGDTLTLAAGDLEVTGRIRIPAVIQQEGSALLAGGLTDFAGVLPADDEVVLVVDDDGAHLDIGTTQIHLPLLDEAEIPALPDLPAPYGRLSGRDFAQAVKQVAVAAGTDDALPVLTSVHLETAGRYLQMAATDRYRVAFRKLPLARTGRRSNGPQLIAAKDLKRTAHDLKDDEEVTLGRQSTTEPLAIAGAERTFTHQEIEGKFPTLGPMLPTAFAARLIVDSKALTRVLTRIKTVGERNVPLHMDLDPGRKELRVRSGTDGWAKTVDRLDAHRLTGEAMTVSFNPRFLLDGVRAIGGKQLQVNFVSPHKPALLHAAGATATDLRYLIMPVRWRE
ncbi:DNA polymerase III subunit beta [Streptomyces sp. A7024]|uniref:DNA polymerase III subunit beta n=1 Tax=Streptomyces coryli TaxID=1128680 RepID=A0A6G4UF10_9ACTN|nr:DNA polymerase III subunit beta [Streptomyces coryli]NGN70291.1 DNA polymerase III subunit beta [Streptomyces coryli]